LLCELLIFFVGVVVLVVTTGNEIVLGIKH
jgi:hypothetical protein